MTATVSTIPVRELVKDLKKQFEDATAKFPKVERGNKTYRAQCDFAWYVHEITMGPSCLVYEHVNNCKQFIDGLKTSE